MRSQNFAGIGLAILAVAVGGCFTSTSFAQMPDKVPSSYSPVVEKETFDAVRKRMEGEKAAIQKRQADLLAERYDLSDKPSSAKMFRGKAVQEGARAKLASASRGNRSAACRPMRLKRRRRFRKVTCRCRMRIIRKAG
jgi:hypothetical protein